MGVFVTVWKRNKVKFADFWKWILRVLCFTKEFLIFFVTHKTWFFLSVLFFFLYIVHYFMCPWFFFKRKYLLIRLLNNSHILHAPLKFKIKRVNCILVLNLVVGNFHVTTLHYLRITRPFLKLNKEEISSVSSQEFLQRKFSPTIDNSE